MFNSVIQELLFYGSFACLAAILCWELISILGVLRKSARLASAIRRDQKEGAIVQVSEVPAFTGSVFESDCHIGDNDLRGKSTALLFIDYVSTSDLGTFEITSLLMGAHEDRELYIFVGGPKPRLMDFVGDLRSVAKRFQFKSIEFLEDRDYTIAQAFGIDRFPVLVLAGHDRKIERVWTKRTKCRKLDNSTGEAPRSPAYLQLSKEGLG